MPNHKKNDKIKPVGPELDIFLTIEMWILSGLKGKNMMFNPRLFSDKKKQDNKEENFVDFHVEMVKEIDALITAHEKKNTSRKPIPDSQEQLVASLDDVIEMRDDVKRKPEIPQFKTEIKPENISDKIAVEDSLFEVEFPEKASPAFKFVTSLAEPKSFRFIKNLESEPMKDDDFQSKMLDDQDKSSERVAKGFTNIKVRSKKEVAKLKTTKSEPKKKNGLTKTQEELERERRQIEEKKKELEEIEKMAKEKEEELKRKKKEKIKEEKEKEKERKLKLKEQLKREKEEEIQGELELKQKEMKMREREKQKLIKEKEEEQLKQIELKKKEMEKREREEQKLIKEKEDERLKQLELKKKEMEKIQKEKELAEKARLAEKRKKLEAEEALKEELLKQQEKKKKLKEKARAGKEKKKLEAKRELLELVKQKQLEKEALKKKKAEKKIKKASPEVKQPIPEKKKVEEESILLDKDIRKVLTIADKLLEKLPEEVIDEFAQSKDFELYERVITKYKLK